MKLQYLQVMCDIQMSLFILKGINKKILDKRVDD